MAQTWGQAGSWCDSRDQQAASGHRQRPRPVAVPTDLSGLLTTAQVAAQLGCTTTHVHSLVRAGRLSPVITGGRGSSGHRFDPGHVAAIRLERGRSSRAREQLDPAWVEAIGGYCSYLLAGGQRESTTKRRRYWLRRFAIDAARGPWEITRADLVLFLSQPGWAPETRKCASDTLRGFYRWAVDDERVEVDPSRRLPRVRVPAGLPRPAPERVLLQALEEAPTGDVRLMVLLAALAGLRRAEIAGLRTSDVADEGLRVHGKGGKTRLVPLAPVLREQLEAREPGWVFPSPRRPGQHISADYVGRHVSRALGPGWTPHTLRHRFASRAYAGTRDLRAVQELLGHAKPETTMRYTLVPHEHLTAAVTAAGL